MKSNTWFKLAGVSLGGIVLSFGILWGAQQVNQYNSYGNQMQMNRNQMQMNGNMNNQGSSNMQGGMMMDKMMGGMMNGMM